MLMFVLLVIVVVRHVCISGREAWKCVVQSKAISVILLKKESIFLARLQQVLGRDCFRLPDLKLLSCYRCSRLERGGELFYEDQIVFQTFPTTSRDVLGAFHHQLHLFH